VIRDVAVAAILVGTLAGILVRPWGRSEAWPAAMGAVLVAASGAVGRDDLRASLDQTAGVLLFLLGMMLLSWVADQAGVFAWLAEGCAVLARGSGWGLFAAVVGLAAVVTALLSLDTTVIMLTPIIYRLALRRRLDPVPMLFACVFVANIGSLLLPVSNLSNLLMYRRLGLDFGGFVAMMWPLELVAVLATGLALGFLFRHRIPRRFTESESGFPPVDRWLVGVAAGMLLTLVALIAFGLADRALAGPALAGGGLLVLAGLLTRRLTVRAAARAVSWNVFVFIVAMTLLVRAVEGTLLAGVTLPVPDGPVAALWGSALATTAGSNAINNLPMAVLALAFLPPARDAVGDALAVGTLLGTNIGSTLSVSGSLATILWLDQLRARGVAVGTRDYLRVALLVTPVVLIVTLLVATLLLW
jgi:arsenical pump membrane protein